MDDVFAIVKKTVVNDLAHFNDQNSSIKLTMESEKDGKLPFMDVIVTRCGGNKLGTTVYRKATHTGRYLHFNSNNLESVKRSVAVSLFRRLNYITLGEAEKQAETNTVGAGHSRRFIEHSKRAALRKKSKTWKPNQQKAMQQPAFLTLVGFAKR